MTKAELEAVRDCAGRLGEERALVKTLRRSHAKPEEIWSAAAQVVKTQGQLRAAERELARLEDPILRDALLLRYVEGLTWAQAAQRLGGGNTAEALRQMARRYFVRQQKTN